MNLDIEKLTEKLQKRYNIPLRELKDIYETSETQTAESGQAPLGKPEASGAVADVTEIMKRQIIDGLHTDGGHHKQWYLELILQLICTNEEYEKIKETEGWEEGIAP